MNRAFDYNGVLVSASKPEKKLRTVKKVISIDSGDRDTSKFYTNGDFTIYLPRQYNDVVGIRLLSGEFPPTVFTSVVGGALTHSYASGPNNSSAVYSADVALTKPTFYFFLDIDGLSYSDELATNGNRSGYCDGFFAKIPAISNGTFIEYNDKSVQDNITRFHPALGTLDRLRIRVRTHAQQGNTGFMYWTTDGAYAASGNRTAEFTLCLEIEMLDNGFDDFSTLETRINTRS
jgi:hypothetical protein